MASFHALLPLSRPTWLQSLPPVVGLLQSHQIGVPQMPPLGCLASVMWDPKDHQATCRARV